MFVIDLHYVAPLEKLDRIMPAHVKFLQTYYSKDIFITSGRKVPRSGGIILARGATKEEIQQIMSEDPFVANKLAEFTVTEFLNSQVHPKFKGLFK